MSAIIAVTCWAGHAPAGNWLQETSILDRDSFLAGRARRVRARGGNDRQAAAREAAIPARHVQMFALDPDLGILLSRRRKSESGWKLLIPKRKK